VLSSTFLPPLVFAISSPQEDNIGNDSVFGASALWRGD